MPGTQIRLNGKPTTTEARSVADLLAALKIGAAQPGAAVAVNGDLVPRAQWPETELNDGDRVEIVRAVQGG